jgi:hypothetical protein
MAYDEIPEKGDRQAFDVLVCDVAETIGCSASLTLAGQELELILVLHLILSLLAVAQIRLARHDLM